MGLPICVIKQECVNEIIIIHIHLSHHRTGKRLSKKNRLRLRCCWRLGHSRLTLKVDAWPVNCITRETFLIELSIDLVSVLFVFDRLWAICTSFTIPLRTLRFGIFWRMILRRSMERRFIRAILNRLWQKRKRNSLNNSSPNASGAARDSFGRDGSSTELHST